jgi:hypothetical protein
MVRVPPFNVVDPVKVLVPVSAKVPVDNISDPPTPEITPSITPLELVIVKFFAPNKIELPTDAVTVRTDALLVTPVISKVASLINPLEL